MPILDQRTISVARTLLILAAVGFFIYGARHTLIAFVLAIFFAYLVAPLISRVERWRWISRGSRTVAIAEVYIFLALVCTGIAVGIGPGLADNARQFASTAPGLLEKLGSGDIVHQIGSTRGWSNQTQLRVEHFIALHRDQILTWIQKLGVGAGTVLAQAFWIVLIPILAIPFLNDAPEMLEFLFRALRLRPKARTAAEVVLQDVHSMAANYIRAQLILAGLALVAYTAVLALFRLQYGIVLGVFAGVLEFLPLVGPAIGAVTIIGVALLTGFHRIWLLLVFLACWRMLQDYFNSPRLMHDRVQLNPFVVIFAILAGGEIAGVLGVFLSVPVAATIKIIWRSWRAFNEQDSFETGTADKSEIKAA